MRLLVCGALHHDVIVRAPRLPRLDETLRGASVRYAFGGKGGNQAVAAARMGAHVAMIGAVGQDAAGETLVAELTAAGVDTRQVARLAGASGMSVAIVDAAGDYGAVIVSGVNQAIDPAALRIPEGTGLVLLQNEIAPDVNLSLARQARAAGARIILNAAPATGLPAGLLALTDLLIVNRVEAADLLGEAATDEATALALGALGPAEVIVTLGADGLLWSDRGRTGRMAAFSVTPQSSHGAGDMFTGALAAERARGAALLPAARFAAAAAALHVATAPDARASLDRQAVLALLSQ